MVAMTDESIVGQVTGRVAEIQAAREAYDPVTGEGYSKLGAQRAWSESMNRSGPEWNLRGPSGAWYWAYWNFKATQALVRIEDDGFHWTVLMYDEPWTVLAEGVTTSLYEAFQSAVQGREVTRGEQA